MKILIFFVILGAIIYGFLMFSASLITGSYESIEYGVKFNYPSSLLASEKADKSTLEIKKASQEEGIPFVFFKKYKNEIPTALSYRIPQEFGKEMRNEKLATFNGIKGISFNWPGVRGLESAFAFEAHDRDYVLSTSGMPDKDIQKEFDMILGSLSITYQ